MQDVRINFGLTLPEMLLKMTCSACPEQYDAYVGEERVGYLRLRHGYFYATAGSPSGPEVYEARTKGDGLFAPDEREHHLTKASEAILAAYLGRSRAP